MSIRAFISVPQNLREWSTYLSNAEITVGLDSLPFQAAGSFLGRGSSTGTPEVLTSADFAFTGATFALNRSLAFTWTGNHQWSGTAPYTELYETDGTTNKRRWRTSATGGKFTITYVKDDGTAATTPDVLSVDPAPTSLIGEHTLVRFGSSGSNVRAHALAFSAGTDPANPEFILDPSFGVAAFNGLYLVAFAEDYAGQTNYISLNHDATNGTLDTTGALVISAGSYVRLGSSSGPLIRWGTGTPEGAVTAPVGSLFLRTDGGAGTTLYVKQSGTGNTGWAGK